MSDDSMSSPSRELADARAAESRRQALIESLAIKAASHEQTRVAESAVAYGGRQNRLSVEEYLRLEASRDKKHEYVAGEIFAMAGASESHNRISLNLAALLRDHARKGPCRVYMADFKLRVQIGGSDIIYYPDVMVACTRKGLESHYLRHPTLVIEVLSPATEAIDRQEKAWSYRQIPTLEEYVLVAQVSPEVTLYRRIGDWAPIVLGAPDDVVRLDSIDLDVPLRAIYEDIEFHPR